MIPPAVRLTFFSTVWQKPGAPGVLDGDGNPDEKDLT
jgi:hypothetical protein